MTRLREVVRTILLHYDNKDIQMTLNFYVTLFRLQFFSFDFRVFNKIFFYLARLLGQMRTINLRR